MELLEQEGVRISEESRYGYARGVRSRHQFSAMCQERLFGTIAKCMKVQYHYYRKSYGRFQTLVVAVLYTNEFVFIEVVSYA